MPLAAEAIPVHRHPGVEPGDEVPRGIGRVPLLQVLREQLDVLGAVEIGGGRREVALRLRRLLLEADEAVIAVELHHAVVSEQVAVGHFVDRDRAAALRAPELDEVGQRVADQVVARDHEQVVAREPGLLDNEGEVADRPEPILVRGRAVVVNGHVRRRPVRESRSEPRVRDEVDPLDVVQIADPFEQVVEHRPLRERQEHLRDRVG